jgi:hypothetical protein
VEDVADSMRPVNCQYDTEVNMKARLLACAAAGLACAFPVAVFAQGSGADASRPYGAAPPPPYAAGAPPYAAAVPALPAREIVASARSAGFEPLHDPVRRGPVYVMRAVNRQGIRVRLMADARSGRILSISRPFAGPAVSAYESAPPPPPPPRYQPYLSGRGYSEDAPLPPGDVPNYRPDPNLGLPPVDGREGRLMPPGRGPTLSTKKVAGQPPLPRSRPGETAEVTGSVPEARAAAAPPPVQSPPTEPNPMPAKPQMVPIAPLE